MWKAIEGTNGMIEVNEQGEVRSLLRGTPKILKTQADNKGYHRVRVTICQVKMSFKVHREVAKAFIPNPDNLPQVNHMDGDKNNNCVSNLEWVTNRENANHAIENGLWENVFKGAKRANELQKKPVIGCFARGDEQKSVRFGSVREAEKYIGSRHISDVLKGKRSHVKGWTFRYESEVMPNGIEDSRAKCEAEAVLVG